MAEFPTIATIFIKILKLVSIKERNSCSEFMYNMLNFFEISITADYFSNVEFLLLLNRALYYG
jgi:hypothetical protein